MATTTNYGWDTPDDTDLVKDGAAAIRTLGSSVDTTTKALNPSTTLGDVEYRSATANTNTRLAIGTTGQVLTVSAGVPAWATASTGALALIKAATTFSNVAGTGTTFDNVFTSTYKYYVVYVQEFGAASDTDDFQLQLLYSGTAQAANYFGSSVTAVYNSGTLANIQNNASSQFTMTNSSGNVANATRNAGVINFSSVGINNSGMNYWGQMYNGYNEEANTFVGKINASQTWTGFRLKSSSSNVSGIVSVYGYGN